VCTSNQAQKLLAETPPDALLDFILMDVVITGTNGFQRTRALRRDAFYMHIPIIMLTVKKQKTDRVLALRRGTKWYLVKLLDADELLAKYTSSLNRYHGALIQAQATLLHPRFGNSTGNDACR